jgi:hypothetical protein
MYLSGMGVSAIIQQALQQASTVIFSRALSICLHLVPHQSLEAQPFVRDIKNSALDLALTTGRTEIQL